MSDPTKWERNAPRRLEATLDELRKLKRTAAKDYEPIPEEHAQELVRLLQEGFDELMAAYRPYLGSATLEDAQDGAAAVVALEEALDDPDAMKSLDEIEEECIASALQISPLDNPNAVAFFINKINPELLPIWSVHLCTRITDEFYEAFEKEKKK